jgi:hypothetical protein
MCSDYMVLIKRISVIYISFFYKLLTFYKKNINEKCIGLLKDEYIGKNIACFTRIDLY